MPFDNEKLIPQYNSTANDWEINCTAVYALKMMIGHNDIDERRAIVLGAGASRGVSYQLKREIPSPLGKDFFDLLQRWSRKIHTDHATTILHACSNILCHVRQLSSSDYWYSMEYAFYTLHLRASLANAIGAGTGEECDQITKEFAVCIQALLRSSHAKEVCEHHKRLFKRLERRDTIINFNYDLVSERALRGHEAFPESYFGRRIYGLGDNKADSADDLIILKLHGSSNWTLTKNRFEVRTKNWSDFDDSPGYRGATNSEYGFPILLPYWDKKIETRPWLGLWRKAYKRLKSTTQLLVWGYSLPKTDIKAQQLFWGCRS